jgi:hypothetical protein
VVKVEDRFREELVKVDPSSIESMEYLSDASLLAVGCGSGVIKVLSVAQSSIKETMQTMFNSSSKVRTTPPSPDWPPIPTAANYGTLSWPSTHKVCSNTGTPLPVSSYSLKK